MAVHASVRVHGSNVVLAIVHVMSMYLSQNG